MKVKIFLLSGLFCFQLNACIQENNIQPDNNQNEMENSEIMEIQILIGPSSFSAELKINATAQAFIDRLPLTLTMIDLNNNEKYFDLTEGLPANASNPGTIRNGDLMLYGSNTLVLFYKSFATSYNYTRIGRINDPEGLAHALGSGEVAVTFKTK
ncbi:hypothetical protein FHG64_17520 [Antarcticibacterium flavum]|uniref:Cyclophilin-like domain-containing protein n=1 Tax=Antarcticibacterium flavum TaxID=2058175 RepID=A0A5B7X7H7_9FLAO|nr:MULTISPECIES: cyclophilin-like fold protein [Antarcticibacterium]MCM4159233.1 hypothetical protein [Antarcticibacterium sp. W02-3]QCY71050.1 hypothetical protein FHG64_17520 [Antarcticibacterium flavum]